MTQNNLRICWAIKSLTSRHPSMGLHTWGLASEANQEKWGQNFGRPLWNMAIGKNFEQLKTKCEGQVCGDAAPLRNSNDAAGAQQWGNHCSIFKSDSLHICAANRVEEQSISASFDTNCSAYCIVCYMQGRLIFCGAQRPRKSVISLTRRQARQKKTRQSRKWLRSVLSSDPELSLIPASEWRAPAFHLGTRPRLSG